MNRRLSCFLAVAAFLAGCNGTTQTNTVPLTPVITQQRLYVGSNTGPGGTFRVYNLPISSTSTPAFSLPSNNVVSIAVDPVGNVAVGNNVGTINYYTTPVLSTSAPSVTFASSFPQPAIASAFLNANNTSALFVANGATKVNRFNPPFTNASVPATTTSNGLTSANGVAFDGSNNLYVSNVTATGSQLKVYASPYTAAATVTTAPLSGINYRKIAIFSQILVATSVAPSQLDVYTLPLTNASLPAFSITNGVNAPDAVAFDAGGTMFVGNLGNDTVTEFSQPLGTTSTPIVSLQLPSGFNIFGIAVGP